MKTEVGGQRNSVGAGKLFRHGHHLAQHFSNFLEVGLKFRVDGVSNVSASQRGSQPVGSFLQFPIRIRKFADEVQRVFSFRP